MVGLKDISGFISVLAWPLVVIIALIAFHRPLSDFLKMVAQRATRLSVTQFFAFELQLPEALHPKLDQYLPVLQAFASDLEEVPPSSSSSTLSKLWGKRGDKAVDYMIVDLESGKKWLTSRLFIFAVMLERMRGLQCLVFLETHTDVPRSFLGTASPHDVRWSLAQRYPWREEAYVKAQIGFSPMMLFEHGALEPEDASKLVLAFLEMVQVPGISTHSPDPEKASEWEFRDLKGRRSHWERANWIDGARLEHDLRDVLHKSADCAFEDSLDISQVGRVQALLRRKGSFVALTNKEGQFNSLVDRKILLEQVAERIGKVSDDQTLGE